MSGYRVVINTESYKKKRCSKRNWEPGTLNNFMKALNGWKIIEPNLKKLRWRIEFFAGNGGAWDDPEWEEWLNQPKNSFKYQDELCGFERIAKPEPYGFKQGYFNIDNVIKTVKKEGKAIIPFKWCYDSRQYDNHMDGCYMEITKVR